VRAFLALFSLDLAALDNLHRHDRYIAGNRRWIMPNTRSTLARTGQSDRPALQAGERLKLFALGTWRIRCTCGVPCPPRTSLSISNLGVRDGEVALSTLPLKGMST
jgi:hypothetical protein